MTLDSSEYSNWYLKVENNCCSRHLDFFLADIGTVRERIGPADMSDSSSSITAKSTPWLVI